MAASDATVSRGLEGKLVTLFGGGGFIGRHAAQALMQAGARVRIAQRHPKRAFSVRALGNLGQVQFAAVDAGNAESVTKAATGSDVIVNLIATFKGDLDRANVATTAHIAAAAAQHGAALIQISAIGARGDSPSRYGRSKAAAEAAARAALPSATILRPSIVFGREDQFINRFAGLIGLAPVVPVLAPATRFQPVFVGDVAAGIASVAADMAMHGGKTYELGGPQILSMRQIFEWIAHQIGRTPLLVDLPDLVSGTMAKATGWLPGAPITADQWAMLGEDNIVGDGALGLADLGRAATPLDAVADGWLDSYRRHGRFAGLKPTPA